MASNSIIGISQLENNIMEVVVIYVIMAIPFCHFIGLQEKDPVNWQEEWSKPFV